jgi:outer membrane protein OmpA-like peptidoglycan-associated protein
MTTLRAPSALLRPWFSRLLSPWLTLALVAQLGMGAATAQTQQATPPTQPPQGSGAAPTTSAAPLKSATVDDFVNQLAPPPALTRSLGRNIVPQKRQIDLVVNFDFDSTRLQPASRPLLENLAQAMNTERLGAIRFKVEGHTDGKGTAKYNDELSARRAQAVAEFLANQGVAATRLEAQGKGFAELLNKDRPDAAENRRVRIVTVD